MPDVLKSITTIAKIHWHYCTKALFCVLMTIQIRISSQSSSLYSRHLLQIFCSTLIKWSHTSDFRLWHEADFHSKISFISSLQVSSLCPCNVKASRQMMLRFNFLDIRIWHQKIIKIFNIQWDYLVSATVLCKFSTQRHLLRLHWLSESLPSVNPPPRPQTTVIERCAARVRWPRFFRQHWINDVENCELDRSDGPLSPEDDRTHGRKVQKSLDWVTVDCVILYKKTWMIIIQVKSKNYKIKHVT